MLFIKIIGLILIKGSSYTYDLCLVSSPFINKLFLVYCSISSNLCLYFLSFSSIIPLNSFTFTISPTKSGTNLQNLNALCHNFFHICQVKLKYDAANNNKGHLRVERALSEKNWTSHRYSRVKYQYLYR